MGREGGSRGDFGWLSRSSRVDGDGVGREV